MTTGDGKVYRIAEGVLTDPQPVDLVCQIPIKGKRQHLQFTIPVEVIENAIKRWLHDRLEPGMHDGQVLIGEWKIDYNSPLREVFGELSITEWDIPDIKAELSKKVP